MNFSTITPFDRIEDAHEYLTLLGETVADNRKRIEADITEVTKQNSQRCLEVLKLVSYNLERLDKHLRAGQQTLNNLRKLRRVLESESSANATIQQKIGEMPGTEAVYDGP